MRALLIASLLILSGCAVQRQQLRPGGAAQPRTFAVTAQSAPRELSEETPRELSSLLAPASARRLRRGTRAALVAPADCARRRGDAAPDAPAHVCDLVMASMEQQLSAAGFRIIPWQALAAIEATSTLEAARQLNAEVVFELGAITPSLRAQRTTLSFALASPQGGLTPVQVHSSVGHRCAALLQQHPELPAHALPTTLSVSAIDVISGHPIWLYKKRLQDHAVPTSRTLYFRERAGDVPSDAASGDEASREARQAQISALYDEEDQLRATGGAMLLSGGLLTGVGGITLGAAQNDTLGAAGALMLGVGLIALVADASIVVPRLGVASGRADELAYAWNDSPGRALDPEQVICATAPVPSPWQPGAEPASSFTFDPDAPLLSPEDARPAILDAAAADMIDAMQRAIE